MGYKMSRNNKKIVGLFSFLLLLFTLTIFGGFIQNYNKSEEINLGSITALSPHNPILLWNESALSSFPDKSGTGASGNPYKIENFEIDAAGSGSCIDIRNTRSYLEIINCTIFYSGSGSTDAGIRLDNCSNVKIINCTAYNNRYGVYLIDSPNNSISGDTPLFNNSLFGIRLDDSINNIISGITTYSNSKGIYTEYSHNCTITKVNTSYSSGSYGMHIFRSADVKIFDSTASHNGYYGIVMDIDCFNSTLIGNTANNNGRYGIYMRSDSSYGNVSWNTASLNNLTGILDAGSYNNTYVGNNLSKNFYNGLKLSDSENATLLGNTMEGTGVIIRGDIKSEFNSHDIIMNTLNGNPLYYYKNAVNLGTLDFTNAGQVILANCNDSQVTGLDVSGGAEGITLGYSNNNTVHNNNVSFSQDSQGIYLYRSHYNNISKNNADSNRLFGIHLDRSDNNNISRNNVSFQGMYGLYIYYSNTNTINDNQVLNNTEYGIHPYSAYYNILLNNELEYNNDHGLFLEWSYNNTLIENTILNSGGHGIYLKDSPFNKFFDSTIKNSGEHGILLDDSPNTRIMNCIVSYNNKSGIVIDDSASTIIVESTVSFNRMNGLTISSASDNTNIIDCTFTNNDESGVFVEDSDYTSMIGSSASYNGMTGLVLDSTSDSTDVINNYFIYNVGYGIECNGSQSFFYLNQIYGNSNCNISKQTIDRGTDNFWYQNTIGSGNCDSIPGNGGLDLWFWVLLIAIIGALIAVVIIKRRS